MKDIKYCTKVQLSLEPRPLHQHSSNSNNNTNIWIKVIPSGSSIQSSVHAIVLDLLGREHGIVVHDAAETKKNVKKLDFFLSKCFHVPKC